jgi:hypothetical protein
MQCPVGLRSFLLLKRKFKTEETEGLCEESGQNFEDSFWT